MLESFTTSKAGWFVFRDLWPGDRYKVVDRGPGRGKAEMPEVTGKAGETHDFGSIVLTGIDGYLAGRVVGSDGRPIASATVFNRGDGPRAVEALTDDQGRFRLEGLFPGIKYAFARKDGYRFTGDEGRRRRRRADRHDAQDDRAAPGLEARSDGDLRRSAGLRPADPDPALGQIR